MRSAHLVYAYLHRTENWLHRRLLDLKRYSPVVLTGSIVNGKEFSIAGLRSYSRLNVWKKALYRLPMRLPYGFGHSHSRYYLDVLDREPCELLHSHFGQVALAHAELRRLAKHRLDMRTVTSFYGWDLGALLNGDARIAQALFDTEDAFILEGPHMAKRLCDAGCPREKLFVNSLGVDLTRFPFKIRPPRSDLEILAVGRFVEKKGLLDAIQAVRIVRSTGNRVRLSIVGDGPDRPRLEAAIRDGSCGEYVTLLGAVSYEKLIELYYLHDVLLQPSRTASDGDTEGGAPVCLIEGMASGLPVVATRHADIPYIVSEGENALLVDEGCVDELAAALIQLSRNETLRAQFAAHGRVRAKQHFDATVQSARLEDAYDLIVGNVGSKIQKPANCAANQELEIG